MGSIEPRKDGLVAVQQELFSGLKMSHRMFLRNFYWSALAFPVLITIEIVLLLLFARDWDSIVGIVPFFFGILFPLFLWVRSMKATMGFVRWSGPFLQDVEKFGRTSGVLVGLTEYITRLFRAAFIDTARARDPREISSRELLAELHYRERLKRVVLVLSLGLLGIVVLSLIAWGSFDPSIWQASIFLGILAMLVGVLVLVGVLLGKQAQWTKSVEHWVHIYDALDQWGQHIQSSFLDFSQPPPGEGGN